MSSEIRSLVGVLHSGGMVDVRRIRFGLYEANLVSGELFKNGQKIRLQEQPFLVLVALLERPGEVVTRDNLRQRLWPSDTFVDFEHSLNTAINKVRDALGDTAANPRFVETLPRRGYRFIAPVTVSEGASAVAPRAEESAAQVVMTSTPDVSPTGVAAGEVAEAREAELPRASRSVSRTLFGLLQTMYLVFYGIGLWRLQDVVERGARELGVRGEVILTIVLLSGAVGVALRLYTVNATLFDYRWFGQRFSRVFLLVLVVDLLWALSPLLLVAEIGLGPAFAGCAALVYSPFAQRVLAWMAWPERQ